MINVEFMDDGDRRRLLVQGHGPGPKGADIFCAGASALIISLEKNLQGIEHDITAQDGLADVASAAPESKAAFNHCFQGFLALEELYPAYYRVRTMRV